MSTQPTDDPDFTARMALFQTRASLYADTRAAALREASGGALGGSELALEALIALQQLELVRAWMEGNLHGIIWMREHGA